jgi:hypothetical protein
MSDEQIILNLKINSYLRSEASGRTDSWDSCDRDLVRAAGAGKLEFCFRLPTGVVGDLPPRDKTLTSITYTGRPADMPHGEKVLLVLELNYGTFY